MKIQHLIACSIMILLAAGCAAQPATQAVQEPTPEPTQIVPTPEPLPTPTPACRLTSKLKPEWEILVCDTFDDNQYGWYEGEDKSDLAKVDVAVRDGKYMVDVVGQPHSGYSSGVVQWFGLQNAKDFLISMDGRISSKNRDIAWGINYWGTGKEFYSFGIGKEGWYYLDMLQGGKWYSPIRSKGHSAIAWDDTNNLTILVEGDTFNFYVNDELVNSYESDVSFGEEISLFIQAAEGASATFTFDNLLIKVP